MKIFLLALLGLAAGGVVKTISTSDSTSDPTVAPPDSFAISNTASPTNGTPSSTNPTSSPSSISSIDSTSTSSPTAPAGDDIRDIAVSMSFTAEAIDNGSDKEMFSNIKNSVGESLHEAVGTHVTMNKIDVVETAPTGRRLAAEKEIIVTYTAQVEAPDEAAVRHELAQADFITAITTALGNNNVVVKDTPTADILPANKVCADFDATMRTAITKGKIVCTNNATVASTKVCVRDCEDSLYYAKTKSTISCKLDGNSVAVWDGDDGECDKYCPTTPATSYTGKPDDGHLVCDDSDREQGAGKNCPVKCDTNYQLKQQSDYKCGTDGAWAGATVGKCVAACPGTTANVGCWTSAGIGKCATTNAGGACTVDEVVCQNQPDDKKCEGGTGTVVTGKCKDDVCMYKKLIWIPLTLSFKVEGSDTQKIKDIVAGLDDTFNNGFKMSVAGVIEEVNSENNGSDSVSIKEIKDNSRRRLGDKFLQDGPTRMLQVEYSVQVNESDAAAAKAALDAPFMNSSNLT